jgi:hypothetical protein
MKRRLALITVAGVLGLGAFEAAAAQAYVYWAENTGGEIARADNDGSAINDSFIAASTPGPIAVDSTHVYWGNAGIGRANLNGTDAEPSWIPDPGGTVTSIATDGTYIYWTDGTDYIGRALLDGSDPTPDFINAHEAVDSLTIASGTIFFASGHDIYTVPAGGSVPSVHFLTVPGTADTLVEALATADGYLYWSADALSSGGAIGATETNDPSVNPNLVSSSSFIGGIATDGTYLYWSEVAALSGGPGEIYRATLDGGTAIAGTPQTFASEMNTPAGVAVDAGIDPTTTTVSCAPATVGTGQPSACTATVADSASSSIPTGTVAFSGSRGAFFTGGPCELAPSPGGGSASCTLGANLTVGGSQSVTASYAGNALHSPSSGQATVCSGSAAQCGGGSKPPPAAASCLVPKLKGKTLAQARTLLRKAHCKLGKVTKPKLKKHHKQPPLVVSSTKPGARTKLANGAKVAVTLAAKRAHRRR